MGIGPSGGISAVCTVQHCSTADNIFLLSRNSTFNLHCKNSPIQQQMCAESDRKTCYLRIFVRQQVYYRIEFHSHWSLLFNCYFVMERKIFTVDIKLDNDNYYRRKPLKVQQHCGSDDLWTITYIMK